MLLKFLFSSVAAQVLSGIKLKSQRERTTFELTSRIAQIESSKLDDFIFCTVRTLNDQCILLKLHFDSDELAFEKISDFSKESCSMTSVHLR